MVFFTQLIIQILVAILAFGIIIFVHELGHFLVAKAVGVTVHEFALGMGPRILSFKRSGTLYAIRLVPIGGFVQMEGEDSESNDAGAFCQKKIWQRILIVIAGASMNILLGFFILLGLTINSDGLSSTTVAVFDQGASNSQALQIGDRITHIDDIRVRIGSDLIFQLMRDDDGIVDVRVERDGEKIILEDIDFKTPLTTQNFKVFPVEKTFLNVVKYSVYWTIGTVRQVWFSFIDLVTGKYGLNQLSGPVGVTTAIGEATGMGLSSVLTLIALITINIGIFNLLPIPALDGGRLVFLLIEAIFRRPVPAKYEAYVHAAGLIALFGLMLVVTFNDIIRLF